MPFDFSEGAVQALEHAIDRARESGAAIILLHVMQPILVPGRYESAKLRVLKIEAHGDLRQRLERVATEHMRTGVRIKPWLLQGGDPAQVIVGAAGKTGSDLIVMGSVGRKGIQRLLLGSVAEAVVRNANVPVTVVRERPKRKRKR